MKQSLSLAALAALAVAAPAAAQTPPGPVAASTPIGSGTHPAIMETPANLPTHTVYRPADWAGLKGEKLPVVVWGNGGCRNAGNSFRGFLSDIASYGYFVVALGPIVPEAEALPGPPQPAVPGAPVINPRDPRTLPPPATHTAQLLDAMTWAAAENERAASPYFHRLDPKKIAVMGQSCGGAQAIEASADPRTTTTVIWNSGLFPQPNAMGGGKTMTKADLKLLHAPIAYISGDPQDVAHENANDDFKQLQGIPVFRGWERGVPHGGTYRQPNGGEFGGVAVAWLNWRVKADARSAKMFAGKDCGLCVNPRWVVSRKNIP